MTSPPVWRSMPLLAATAAVVLTGVASPALAQQRAVGDAGRGRALAERLCTGCHIVAPNSATTANPDVPSFPVIAAGPDATPERLAGRIIVPHPAMPTTQLTVGEIRDVVAYILSLTPAR